MDSSQRPPSNVPRAGSEVDAGFERLLKDAMTRRLRAAAGSECIDAETLAAWCDGALPPSERSFVEAHAARCARCQDMLAVMARSAPVDVERSPWSLRQWVMMLAPAATATAAVALWFAVELPRTAPEPSVAQVAVAGADREAVAEAKKEVEANAKKPSLPDAASARTVTAPPADTPPPQTRDERTSSDRVAPAKEGEALRRLAQTKDVDRLEPSSKSSELTKTDAGRARQELAAAVQEEKRKVAASPSASPGPPPTVTTASPSVAAPPVSEPPAAAPPPPPPPAAPARPQAAAPAQQAAQTQQRARPDQQQADQQARGFGGVGGGRSGDALNRAALNERIDVAPVVGARTDASVQWRALSGRIIQHSADKGATWSTQYTLDDQAAIVAGSAPSPTTAWFVGRAGLVVATSDGRTWRRIAFPEPVDLVSVLATDVRVASVTAADRRVFSTTDGGASWSAGKN